MRLELSDSDPASAAAELLCTGLFAGEELPAWLAAAEGVDRETVRTVFIVLLAVTIAVAMKIVGILLVMAFLVVPAVAARPMSGTPERMVLLTALIAMASVLAGLWLSATVDSPGGPSIVIVMSILAGLSLSWAAYGRPGTSAR